jgi:hypothetical protein
MRREGYASETRGVIHQSTTEAKDVLGEGNMNRYMRSESKRKDATGRNELVVVIWKG